MAQPPVKFTRTEALQLDAAEPYVLKFHIPIPLPHRLDPSLPAPPYPQTRRPPQLNNLQYNNSLVTSLEDLQPINAQPSSATSSHRPSPSCSTPLPPPSPFLLPAPAPRPLAAAVRTPLGGTFLNS